MLRFCCVLGCVFVTKGRKNAYFFVTKMHAFSVAFCVAFMVKYRNAFGCVLVAFGLRFGCVLVTFAGVIVTIIVK